MILWQLDHNTKSKNTWLHLSNAFSYRYRLIQWIEINLDQKHGSKNKHTCKLSSIAGPLSPTSKRCNQKCKLLVISTAVL